MRPRPYPETLCRLGDGETCINDPTRRPLGRLGDGEMRINEPTRRPLCRLGDGEMHQCDPEQHGLRLRHRGDPDQTSISTHRLAFLRSEMAKPKANEHGRKQLNV